jgi:X-Pro dipeptidyl-peptidase
MRLLSRRPAVVGIALCMVLGGVAATLPAHANVATDIFGHCSSGGDGKVSHPGPYSIGSTEVVTIPSDVDGQPIEIGLVHPAGVPEGYRSPVIVNASPYITADLKDVDLRTCMPELSDNFVPYGYTIAIVPTRGTSGSGGCPDLMGPAEKADLSKAVTWLGAQPWSNGSVGMIGISYDGSTPWDVASTGNPHLKTIVPLEGVNDLPDLIFGGGRNDWRWWFFAAGYYGEYGYATNNPVESDRDPTVFAQSLNCPSFADGMAATAQAAETGQPDAIKYWQDRNSRPGVESSYKGSIFLVQGLADWNVSPGTQFPWINTLQRNGTALKMLLGQWPHAWPDQSSLSAPTRRPDFPDILLSWFDRWLKGDTTIDTGPGAEVEDSSGRWRADESWPPANAHDETMFATAAGGLATDPVSATSTATLAPDQQSRYYYLSDSGANSNDTTLPASAELTCATCAVFKLPVDGKDLRLSGSPRLDLRNLVPTGPGGTVAAFLYALTPDGNATRLGWGEVDLRFPDGGTTPQAVTTGQQVSASLTLQPLEAVVPAGSTLALVLSQGNANHAPTAPRFPVQLTYGGQQLVVHLPVLNGDNDAYFQPSE